VGIVMTERLDTCRVCGARGEFPVCDIPENMYLTGETFPYFTCIACGCLQIVSHPERIQDYYPPGYYSFGGAAKGGLRERVRDFLAVKVRSSAFSGKAWWEHGDRKALRDAHASFSDSIIDIGCGGGDLVRCMRNIGFLGMVGADPFIDADIVHPNGARVRKAAAEDIDETFDIVMMNHSLEHVWDQRALAADLFRLTKPGGRCILRIPTVDCWAWEEYGVHWVQLDPPRHFYLHSRISIRRLMAATGFTVDAVIDDSTAYQVTGSEAGKLGAPIAKPGQPGWSHLQALPPGVAERAGLQARELNAERRGDQIAVHCLRSIAESPVDLGDAGFFPTVQSMTGG
jgi:SAM-dependent methyltransferase